MPKFTPKSQPVEARRFDALELEDQEKLAAWCGGRLRGTRLLPRERVIQIDTLRGEVEAEHGDYIVRELTGKFRPWPAEVFEATYEPA